MANTKIVAIAIVAVVVVAAIAVGLTIGGSGNGGGDEGGDKIDAQLLLYGNANWDHTIDQQDLDIVEGIVSGEVSQDEYPFADANADGSIDQADVDIVSKLVNREPTVAYVYGVLTDERYGAVEIQYPLTDVVVHRNTPPSVMCQIGAADAVAGYFELKDVSQSALIVAGAVDLGGSARPSDESWQRFMDLDVEVGVGAIFSDASVSTLSDRYDDIEAAGIPLIRLNVSGPYENIAASVTMGFVCGTETEESSLEYAELCWDTMDHIEQAVSGLADEDRKVFVSISRAKTVANVDSNFTLRGELAGGIGLGDVSPEFAEQYPGDGSTSMQSPEALSNYDRYLDAIVYYASEDYGEDAATYAENTWTSYREYYENLDSYESFVVINAMMPISVQVAYTAAVLYPDLVSMDWADEVFQKFYDVASPASYTFEDVIPVFTYDDYAAVAA